MTLSDIKDLNQHQRFDVTALVVAISEPRKGGSTNPLSFYWLDGKKSATGFAVENSKDFFVVAAIGTRAEMLKTAVIEFHAVPQDDRQVQKQSSDATRRNYEKIHQGEDSSPATVGSSGQRNTSRGQRTASFVVVVK